MHAVVPKRTPSGVAPLLKAAPSVEGFREIIAALGRRSQTDPGRFEEELATTASHLSSWPAELRLGGPHFISDVIDGRIPEGVIGLLGGIRLFDAILERETERPLPWRAAEARVEQLTRWLERLGDDRVDLRILDLSPNAWLRHQPAREYDLPELRFPRDEAFWSALASCKALGRLQRLDLSFGHIELEPYEAGSYETINDARQFDFPTEFSLVPWLESAVFRESLEVLSCCGMAPGRVSPRGRKLALPSLRHLDLSGAPRLEAKSWLEKLKLPALRCLVLGSDTITDLAQTTPWEDFDLEQRQVLQHDWCVSSQRDLDGLLFSARDLRGLVARAEHLERLELGGEDFEPPREIEVVQAQTGRYDVAIPW